MLDSRDEPFASIATQLAYATAASREFTGVGGYTYFAVPLDAPFYGTLGDAQIGGVCGKHPHLQTGAFFILFVRGGNVTFLEFVTADEAWPSDESLFTFSLIQAQPNVAQLNAAANRPAPIAALYLVC